MSTVGINVCPSRKATIFSPAMVQIMGSVFMNMAL